MMAGRAAKTRQSTRVLKSNQALVLDTFISSSLSDHAGLRTLNHPRVSRATFLNEDAVLGRPENREQYQER